MESDFYRALFNPRGVAVVGASRNPRKFGHTQVKNLLELGFQGSVYPVNPNADSILGLKCYPRVSDIPGEVDTAIVTVPAPIVPSVIKDCVEKGVKVAVVISSGFRESGEEGAKYEREMVETARAGGLRIIGPNTTGVLCTSTRFTTTFLPVTHMRRGPVAFIAQTGIFAGVMLLHILTAQHFGLSKVVGLGNKCDVDDAEILEYLRGDPETRVVAIYMEGVKDGRRFLEALRRTAAVKPVVILKSGRTEWGSRVALSHTGSMTGRDEIFDAVCRQTGAIRALDFEEMIDYIKAFAFQPLPRGNRVMVMSYSGAGCVTAVDHIVERGLTPATLSDEAVRKLAELYPRWASPSRHHVDTEPIFEAIGSDAYWRVLEILMNEAGVDAVVVDVMALPESMSGAAFYAEKEELVDALLSAKKLAPWKPIVVSISGDREAVDEHVGAVEEAGFPTYPSIPRAVRALSALCRYAEFRRRRATRP